MEIYQEWPSAGVIFRRIQNLDPSVSPAVGPSLTWAEDKQEIKVSESGGRAEKRRVQAAGVPV